MGVVKADLDYDGGPSEEAYLDALMQRPPPRRLPPQQRWLP